MESLSENPDANMNSAEEISEADRQAAFDMYAKKQIGKVIADLYEGDHAESRDAATVASMSKGFQRLCAHGPAVAAAVSSHLESLLASAADEGSYFDKEKAVWAMLAKNISPETVANMDMDEGMHSLISVFAEIESEYLKSTEAAERWQMVPDTNF